MMLPNRKTTFTDQLPGALFSAVAWYLFSFGFSIYIEYTRAYTMYGSLTTLMLFMFWLYFVMYIVLIGVETVSYTPLDVYQRQDIIRASIDALLTAINHSVK